MEHIQHVILDTINLLPLLFLVYLLIEYLEHENNGVINKLFKKTKKFGPLLGAALGTIPQCGFSVVASELFSKKVITLGTLIAIFLATSDEAIPLMMAHPDRLYELLLIIFVKFTVALIFGFLIDAIVKRKQSENIEEDTHTHFHGNCESCDDGILKSAIRHSIKIFVYILVINIILGYFAERIAPVLQFVSSNILLQSALSSLFGIIPNCAASVVLTELYLSGGISLAALIGGLLSGGGVGILILFKRNRNLKENIMIVGIVYAIGVLAGTGLSFLL